ncbi:unnamed protein product [Thelazia callipaeda]|uniref:Uncharacterized protein n=1 Tax=Thelazia callipaeda TaxID=103827 RepID=A0A0N5CQT2_THECL|nr:unnamed protein product [Thelazia callipaeda]
MLNGKRCKVETRRTRRLTDGSGNLLGTNVSSRLPPDHSAISAVCFGQLNSRERDYLTSTRNEFILVQPEIQTSHFGSSSALNRLATIGELDLHKVNTLRQRRTSLPISSNAFAASRATLQSNLTEARGIVTEMLSNKDLPPTLISGLKVVANLLNPQPPPFSLHFDFGLPMVVENPYSGEQLVVSAVSFFIFSMLFLFVSAYYFYPNFRST